MPWCEPCDRELDVDEVTADGMCPSCGTEALEHRPSPWWFKFLAVATVIYLIYRAYQGVTWVVHHFQHH